MNEWGTVSIADRNTHLYVSLCHLVTQTGESDWVSKSDYTPVASMGSLIVLLGLPALTGLVACF